MKVLRTRVEVGNTEYDIVRQRKDGLFAAAGKRIFGT